MCGSDSIVFGSGAAPAAAAVVLSSKIVKGGFNIRKEFLDFVLLACGGPSKMVEHPLEDLVTVCAAVAKLSKWVLNLSAEFTP